VEARNILHLMQKIEVFDDYPEIGHRRIYRSRIEDIGDNYVTIAAPFAGGYFLPPRHNRTFTGCVAGNGCSYHFKMSLLSYTNDPVPLWRVTFPAEIKRVQMRSFVRLDITMHISVELAGPDGQPRVIDTLTKDISAGGLRLVMVKPPTVGEKVKLTLPLDDDVVVAADGKVIRVVPPGEDFHKYEVIIEFVKIAEKIRGQIVKFIFKKQIERRKKETEMFG
jgi:c-di-GMP-binding flagellar brake protein YcgR